MPASSIIPERQLVFSPELAATIGLEEAILLQQLQLVFDQHSGANRAGFVYYTVRRAYLLGALPFWSAEDLQRITRSLADKGVLLIDSPPLLSCEELVFAVNEPQSPGASAPSDRISAHAPMQTSAHSTAHTSRRAETPQRRSAGLLPEHWSPSEDVLQLLALNHNIPRQFALDQLEDFVFYWRERGETSHAWENKFRQQVVSNWRRQQQSRADGFRIADPVPLDKDWQPSADAMDIMARAGIDADFIEQAIPEFILYWLERGAPPKELNTRFIQHIRLQWAKYTSSLTHSTEPRRISDDWQPDDDVFDILQLSHIDAAFARSLLPEFVVYWKESNQVQTSWNSKFIQHVKYHWAKSHQIEQAGTTHAGHQGTRTTGRTRDRSLQDDLTDTSWAD